MADSKFERAVAYIKDQHQRNPEVSMTALAVHRERYRQLTERPWWWPEQSWNSDIKLQQLREYFILRLRADSAGLDGKPDKNAWDALAAIDSDLLLTERRPGTGPNNFARNKAVINYVYEVCAVFGLRPTRNPEKKGDHTSGCDAVLASGVVGKVSYRTVETIWTDAPADIRQSLKIFQDDSP